MHSLNMSSYWCYQVQLRVQDYFTESCYIISIVQQVCRLVDVFVLVFLFRIQTGIQLSSSVLMQPVSFSHLQVLQASSR